MRTLPRYLPALSLYLCACTGEPSAPTSTEPDDAGASTAPAPDSTSTSASSSVHSTPPLNDSDAGQASLAGTNATVSPPSGPPSFDSSLAPNPTGGEASAPVTTDTSTVDSSQTRDDDPTSEPSPLGSRNFACAPSPSPMFQSQEVLEMHIAADFSVVNGNVKETAMSPGTLDPDGSGPHAAIPVEVHARGISRFRDCGYRPFKVKFAEKQKDNVFHKLGKSVKFSTHCGDREGMHDILKAPSLDEYYQRVRMEHLVYQLLAPLETMSLATRLVRITYEDTSTGTEETHLAFVREPEDELGQRCGMAEGEDIPEGLTARNERANLLLYLINNFVIQADVKNRFELVDVDAQLSSSVPYDFDLLGIFRREYLGLDGRSLAQNAEAFADWLRRNQSPELHEEVALMLSKADVMRTLIADAQLTPTNRGLFDEWLGSFLDVLQTFDACQGSESDPSSTACYVLDDYDSDLTSATLMDVGEHSLLLEPPGDRDAIRVNLEAGTLYTVTTSLNATLRSPGGSVVNRLGEDSGNSLAAFSVRAEEGGAYSLEFDYGSSLVCSDMWSNSPEVLARPYAVYEDDHGASLSTATSLDIGTTTEGQFELSTLQGLFDEDWFMMTIGPDTQVFVDSAGSDSAVIEVSSPSDPYVALDTYFFNPTGGRDELTALFPEPGDYVLRAIQGWDKATYSIEVASATE